MSDSSSSELSAPAPSRNRRERNQGRNQVWEGTPTKNAGLKEQVRRMPVRAILYEPKFDDFR